MKKVLARVTVLALLVASMLLPSSCDLDLFSNEQTANVPIIVMAPEYDEATSSAIPLKITGTSAKGKKINQVVHNNNSLALPAGDYEITLVASPLTQNNIMYSAETVSFTITENMVNSSENTQPSKNSDTSSPKSQSNAQKAQ